MKKILLFTLSLIILGVGACFAQQQQNESLTITTYYPSPYGVYKTLRLFPGETPAPNDDCTNAGEMAYYQKSGDLDSDVIVFCNGSSKKWETLGGSLPSMEIGTVTKSGDQSITAKYRNWENISSWTINAAPGGYLSLGGPEEAAATINNSMGNSIYNFEWGGNVSVVGADWAQLQFQHGKVCRAGICWSTFDTTEQITDTGGSSITIEPRSVSYIMHGGGLKYLRIRATRKSTTTATVESGVYINVTRVTAF